MKPTFNIFHAEHIWNSIPNMQREAILSSVFCSKCSGAVSLNLEKVELDEDDKPMDQKALALEGKCNACGGLARKLLWLDEL